METVGIGFEAAIEGLQKLQVLRADHIGIGVPASGGLYSKQEAQEVVTGLYGLLSIPIAAMGLRWDRPPGVVDKHFVYVEPGRLGFEIFEDEAESLKMGLHVDVRVADTPWRIIAAFPTAQIISLPDGAVLFWVTVAVFANVEFALAIRQERTAVGVEESVTGRLQMHAVRVAAPVIAQADIFAVPPAFS